MREGRVAALQEADHMVDLPDIIVPQLKDAFGILTQAAIELRDFVKKVSESFFGEYPEGGFNAEV
jgi:hypothetical protein